MSVVNSINVANTATDNPFVSYVNKNFLEVFEPNLYFMQFAEAPISQVGHKSVTWIKPDRYTVTPSQALLTAWVTPVDTPLKLNTIEVSALQYWIYTVLSDEVLLIGSGYNLASETGKLIWNNMARIVDAVVQTEAMAWTNVLYAATTAGWTRAANRAALWSTNKIFSYDLNELYTRMQENYAPFVDWYDWYVMLVHPRVAQSLRTETGTGWFIDINKYSQPWKIWNGEIGKIANVRIIESAYIQTFASSITVYPSLVIGKQAYGAAQLSAMETFVKELWSGWTADPLNQRMTIGAKTFFAAKRLQEQALYRFESAGAY